MAEEYRDRGRYYPSASLGGNYTPQPGDIIFTKQLDTSTSDTFYSPGHVGIVSAVVNGWVYFVDGNRTVDGSGGTIKDVRVSSRSLTDSYILAYGQPYYNFDSHSHHYWEYNNSMHWSSCLTCGTQEVYAHDLYESGAGFACYVCGYTSW